MAHTVLMKVVTGAVLALSSILPLIFVTQAQAAEGKSVTIRGRVSAVEGQDLKVTTPGGEVLVKLPENVRVSGSAPAKLSDVTEGSYIGATSRPEPDGTLRAVGINIFPPERRGTIDTHRPWDIPGTTMTNATVEKIEETRVEKVQGSMLHLKYKDGEKKLLVSPDTPVVRNVTGSRDLIKPGTGVVITATQASDGAITAVRINAGVDGVMPPM
jgi:hypothetical protein